MNYSKIFLKISVDLYYSKQIKRIRNGKLVMFNLSGVASGGTLQSL